MKKSIQEGRNDVGVFSSPLRQILTVLIQATSEEMDFIDDLISTYDITNLDMEEVDMLFYDGTSVNGII